MRNKSLAFALSILFGCSSIVMGQQSSQPITKYSWRKTSSNQPATTIRATTESGIANASIVRQEPIRVASNQYPAAPTMTRKNFLVGFRQDQQGNLTDAQPSVSDQILQAPSEPTAAPIVEAEVQSNVDLNPNWNQAIPAAPNQQLVYPQPSLSVPQNTELPETNYCDRDCRRNFCNLGCEKKLFNERCNGLEIGGWTNLGYHNRNTIMTNNRKGETNLHQAWLFLDKPAENGGIGYHLDLLYGIDGQDLQAFGNEPTGAPSDWDNTWDNGSYGWALPQAYVTFNKNCWDIKAGKFFSPFGYEVISAPENFFYSHSYTMYYSEPFTMTGIIGERKVRDNMSTILGVTAGWDTAFESNDGGFNLITGTRYQPNEFVDLALTSSLGDSGSRDSGTLTSGVAQVQLTEAVDYVFQADVLNLGDNQEFGIVQYMFRQINPCLKLGARLEWWKSDQLFLNTKSTYEFTMGANYRVNANITVRPEIRFDWGAAAIDKGEAIVGFDAVMTF